MCLHFLYCLFTFYLFTFFILFVYILCVYIFYIVCLHFTGRKVFYTISGDNFSVDRITGVITLKTPLDRERKDLLGNLFFVYIFSAVCLHFLFTFVYFSRCQSNH